MRENTQGTFLIQSFELSNIYKFTKHSLFHFLVVGSSYDQKAAPESTHQKAAPESTHQKATLHVAKNFWTDHNTRSETSPTTELRRKKSKGILANGTITHRYARPTLML